MGRRAGGQAGRRAGGQAGRRAGGQADRRAGGQVDRRASGKKCGGNINLCLLMGHIALFTQLSSVTLFGN